MLVKSGTPHTASLTRREFIWRVAQCGGSAVGAMLALDLLAKDPGTGLQLEGRAPASRNKVAILGAGLAGLCAAYELGKRGYDCTVLEARHRSGGRCWSVRGGDRATEIGGADQVCRFDAGQYMNAGPTRIPGHHTTTLNYCRELGVDLQVFTNVNESAYLHRDGFPLLRFGEARADYFGYTAELLAKVVRKGELERPLTAEDRDKLIAYLRAEGGLNADLKYGPADEAYLSVNSHDSFRRGYSTPPGAGSQPGKPSLPLDFETLVKSGLGENFSSYYEYHQQPTMLTPVGGVDRISRAFETRVRERIQFGAVVREIRRTIGRSTSVRVAYTRSDGSAAEVHADFCVCTIPLPLLARIPADFSPELSAAIAGVEAGQAGKIGLQFKRRFWEEDDRIFGGISRTAQPITQLIYPFDGYNTQKGVVIGYYNFGGDAAAFGRMSVGDREREALAQGAKIHPQYPAEFENSFSVDWVRTPHSQGAWLEWPGDSFDRYYKRLNQPEGPIWLCSEGLTYLGGWMAGAFTSAHKVCAELHQHALAV